MIKDLIAQFLEHLEIEKNRSVKTVENYDRYLRRFLGWAKIKDPDEISETMVRKYRLFLARQQDESGRLLKKNTQNYYVIALRGFLKYLAKISVKSLTSEKVELARQLPREIDFLEVEELERLLKAPSGEKLTDLRDRAVLETLFSTGLRVFELCQLNRQDIDFKRGDFSVRGKGGKIRLVFLSDTAKTTLKSYLDKRVDTDEALFIRFGKKGLASREEDLRLTSRSIQRIVRFYAIKAGLIKKVTPHTLRHSFSTDLLRNGADLRSVQALLGHSSITTTQIYTHVTDRHLQEIHQRFHRKK